MTSIVNVSSVPFLTLSFGKSISIHKIVEVKLNEDSITVFYDKGRSGTEMSVLTKSRYPEDFDFIVNVFKLTEQ